jgi:hypothetical protein
MGVILSQYASVVAARLRNAQRNILASPREGWLSGAETFERSRLRRWPDYRDAQFDAIVFLPHKLFLTGKSAITGALSELLQLLTPKGKLICSALVDIGPRLGAGHLALADLKAGTIPDKIRCDRFQLVRPMRLTVSPASLERSATRTLSDRTVDATCRFDNDAIAITGVFMLKRPIHFVG